MVEAVSRQDGLRRKRMGEDVPRAWANPERRRDRAVYRALNIPRNCIASSLSFRPTWNSHRQIHEERSEIKGSTLGTKVALNLRGNGHRFTAIAPWCVQRQWKRRQTYGNPETAVSSCPVGTGSGQTR